MWTCLFFSTSTVGSGASLTCLSPPWAFPGLRRHRSFGSLFVWNLWWINLSRYDSGFCISREAICDVVYGEGSRVYMLDCSVRFLGWGSVYYCLLSQAYFLVPFERWLPSMDGICLFQRTIPTGGTFRISTLIAFTLIFA